MERIYFGSGVVKDACTLAFGAPTCVLSAPLLRRAQRQRFLRL